MEEQSTETAVESVEPTEVTESNDEMSDDEFASFMDEDNSTIEEPEGTDEVVDESVDLDALYQSQMDDKDSTLDKPMLIKINGKVHKVDNVSELKDLAERGLNFTQKSQKLSEHRKTIEFLSDNGISQDDLDSLIHNRGEEPVVTDDAERESNDIATEILSSDYAEAFKETVQTLPENIRSTMAKDPRLLKAFSIDVESGLAQKIMPQVERLMSVNAMSFRDAYVQAGSKLQESQVSVNNKRNALTSQPKASTVKADGNQDVWAMSDDAFDKYFDNM